MKTITVPNCPICGAPGEPDRAAARFLRLPDAPSQLGIRRCRQCRFRWLDPRPASDETSELYTEHGYYERTTDDYSYARQATEMRSCFQERVDRFREQQPTLPILDIGCATGELLAVARERGLNAIGVEISGDACKIAADRKLAVIQGTIDTIELPHASMGGMHMSHVLEHLPDPVSALTRARTFLRAGALVYIEVPNQFDGILDLIERFRGSTRQFGPFSVHHLSFFTPRSLTRILESCGYEVLSLRTHLPCRRAARPPSLRLALLNMLLAAMDRLFRRGDVISVWARAKESP